MHMHNRATFHVRPAAYVHCALVFRVKNRRSKCHQFDTYSVELNFMCTVQSCKLGELSRS